MKIPLTKSLTLTLPPSATLIIYLIFIAAMTHIFSPIFTSIYGSPAHFALETFKQTTKYAQMEAQENAAATAVQYAHELDMKKAAADAEWRLKKPHAAVQAEMAEDAKKDRKAQQAHELKMKKMEIDADWRVKKAESDERVRKCRIAAEALKNVARKGALINGSLLDKC